MKYIYKNNQNKKIHEELYSINHINLHYVDFLGYDIA